MAEAHTASGPISGTDKTLTFETGKLAGQAGGAVTVSMGDTVVLVTATASKGVREGQDFFPLTVDIEERMYAAGRIPGSFFRREGKASDNAILNCRLIDRPIRPAFPSDFRNEVHVVGTILATDLSEQHDVMAINGASAALSVSGIPFSGPIGAVRIAWTADGEWLPYPTFEEGEASAFEMVVAGRETSDGDDIAIMMVEAGGTEQSWPLFEDGTPKVTEAVLAQGLEAAKTWIQESIDLQLELIEKIGGRPELMSYEPQVDASEEVLAAVVDAGADRIAASQAIADKQERGAAEDALKEELLAELSDRFAGVPNATKQIKAAIRTATKQAVRKRIVTEGVRIDGRSTADIRSLSAEVGVLPAVHGSGLFQRGETQALNVVTLGMPRMEQQLDTLHPVERKRYMHHYNFPPFSTGETGFMRGPKRREIGHGMLAERALVPVLPTKEEFPYTIRTVSDVLSSNGSTSMASVCGSTLSMMDGGVPLRAPVAGIAMGLVFAEGTYTTLTDILGAEDAFGDMDFKVAGTGEFVTALQLDTKIDGIPADVLSKALDQAREARLAILEVMAGAIDEPRDEVGGTAPKLVSFEIPVDKIGEVIGPKGKVINTIQQETGADISVDDDGMMGRVSIGSPDRGAVDEAERQIRLILNPPTAEIGQVYPGKVVNITNFGAFISILPGRDGLLHISKVGGGKRVDRVEDVLSLGDDIEVRVDDIDPNGKVSLSLASAPPAEKGSGSGSGGGGDRGRGDRGGRGDWDRGDRGGRGGGRGDRGGRGRDSDSSSESSSSGDSDVVSFEESFDEQIRDEFGDLGPAESSGGGDRGGRGGRGGGRNRR
jgi:polyribonucleotide nucleotidyltransferase